MRALVLATVLSVLPATSFADPSAQKVRIVSASTHGTIGGSWDHPYGPNVSVIQLAGSRSARADAANRLAGVALKEGHDVSTKHGLLGRTTITITGEGADYRGHTATIVEELNKEHASR